MFFLASCSRETEEKENVIGYMGKARKNPYLAAERYLEAGGKVVESTSGVLKFDEADGTVFAPASSVRSVGDAERILEWVADGGHFVCFLERGEEFWTDVGGYPDHEPEVWGESEEDEINNGINMLLEAVDLKLEVDEDWESAEDILGDLEKTGEEENEALKKAREERLDKIARGRILPSSEVVDIYFDDEQSYAARLGGMKYFESIDDTYYIGDWYDIADHHRFFSRLYGYSEQGNEFMGRITFVSEARLFRNPYLELEQHAELLDAMVANNEHVEFSLGKIRSFTSMLGEHASKAMWALFVLTVLWLWKNLPRFGPLLEVTEGHSRNYLEQVQHVGRFFWRQERSDVLLKSLREAVLQKSGHAFSEHQDSSVLLEKLSESSGMNREQITEAMTLKQVKDSSTMVRITKNLQTLLKQL
ncbi:DUF4350 domain-containing protein [Rubritalea spongiae]|uniref:DUF4350 domain-containing protein n=1 Tax=Rubritalea spongiae TaxID=430797 RepID=A0ABW5DY49_9BACT